MKVRLTLRARAALREIREHHRRDDPRLAERIRKEISDAITQLSRHPEIGPPSRQLPGTRSKLVARYPYRVHYRIGNDVLIVLHVGHAAGRAWKGDQQ